MQRYEPDLAGGGDRSSAIMAESADGEFVKLADVVAAIDAAIELQEEMNYKLGLVNTSKHCLHAAKALRKLRETVAGEQS